ncbi:MAG TPA: hypothetical protein VGN37_26960 [Actinocatenispora sp.]
MIHTLATCEWVKKGPLSDRRLGHGQVSPKRRRPGIGSSETKLVSERVEAADEKVLSKTIAR